MGLFTKKDKSARNSPASIPDTTPSRASAQSANSNPYAYSAPPPPPSYASQRAYSEPTSYGNYSNEPTTYGGSTYSKRTTEPTTYGGSIYGGSQAPEPTGYGASLYNNNTRTTTSNNTNSSNPYAAQTQYGRQPSQPEPESYSSAAAPGGYNYGGSGSNSYQDPYSYQDTALEEEQDPEITKQEIKYTRYASHSSTVNALNAAARAEQAGQSTLLNLEEQGEKLYSTQFNIQMAKTHGDIASQQAKDLKVANRPLFMPHVKNPFSSGANKAIEEQVSLERQRRERGERATSARATHEEKMRKMGLAPTGIPKPLSLEEKAARERQRSMYLFEADEEDEQMERDIDDNLDQLAGASGRLKGLAYAINQKVDEQNKLIVEIGNQAQDVEDGMKRTGYKLKPYGF